MDKQPIQADGYLTVVLSTIFHIDKQLVNIVPVLIIMDHQTICTCSESVHQIEKVILTVSSKEVVVNLEQWEAVPGVDRLDL